MTSPFGKPSSDLDPLRDAAEKAAFVLQGCLFTDSLREDLNSHATTKQGLLAYCRDQAESIARRLGGAEPQLAEAGWLIPPYHPAMLPHHVFAAAAGLAIEACTSTTPASDLLICQQLADDAVFMHARGDLAHRVEATTLAKEAQARSANARMGAPAQKFSDEQLLAEREKWISKHGKERGWIKQAASQLDASERTVGERWKKLNNRK